MKHLQLFEGFFQYQNIIDPSQCFKSHTDLIGAEAKIDNDTKITYGYYTDGALKGKEFMEYYRGENYVAGSNAKSLSRKYMSEEIPLKYRIAWGKLKQWTMEKFPIYWSDRLNNLNKKTGLFQNEERSN